MLYQLLIKLVNGNGYVTPIDAMDKRKYLSQKVK